MANPFYVAPPDFGNPLQELMSGYKTVTGFRDESEGRAARQAASEALMNGGDTKSALARLIGAGQYQGAQVLGQLGKADTTDEIKEYNLARQQGFQGSFFDFKTNLKKAGATRINNNVNTGERAYDTTVGKDYGETFVGAQKAGRNAIGKIQTLDLMDTIADDPNFQSGTGTEKFVLPAKQIYSKFGGDPTATASMETFRALSSKSMLDAIGGSLGTAISNADRDEIKTQVSTLDNSAAGIKKINAMHRAVAKREQEVAKLARDYATKNGRLDAGFDDHLTQWAEKNPLFAKSQSAPTSGGWQEIRPGIRIREKR